MNKKRIVGLGKQIAGSIEKTTAKIMGGIKLQADAKADRVIGLGKQIKGSIKVAAGKVVGNVKLQADGETDQVEGKAQDAIGMIKDVRNKRAVRTVSARRYPRSH